MKLTILGHEDLYAVEQLVIALFPEVEGTVVSRLTRGKTYLTAVTEIVINQKKTRCARRLKLTDETVRLRRRILQQSLYQAALPHLDAEPAWGALSGVRPTKISTKAILDGENPDKILKDVYFVSAERRQLAIDCSKSTVDAIHRMDKDDISLYIGIPFCPTRCSYCSFVSRTIGKKKIFRFCMLRNKRLSQIIL